MNVQDLMQREVATIGRRSRLDLAVEAMRDRDCGCVVVLDEGAGVLGVVTDRDVCLAALRMDRPLSEIELDAALGGDLFTCMPGDTIEEAEQRMGQHQVRRLPVVDEAGKLVGLLALDDIAKQAWREGGLLAPHVRQDAVGRTLGEIGRPHLIE